MDAQNLIGKTTEISRSITEHDLESFAAMSLDRNPIHFDDAEAQRYFFKERIAHGLIGASLLSGALTKLMGHGNVWLSLSISFSKPVYIGDTLRCTLTVTEVSRRGVVSVSAKIINDNSEIVLSGELTTLNLRRSE